MPYSLRIPCIVVSVLLVAGCSDEDGSGVAPQAPTGLTITAVRQPSPCFELVWNPVEHADQYILERKTENDAQFAPYTYVNGSSYRDYDVEPGVRYSYRVQGNNWDAGTGPYSAVVSATLEMPPPPSNIVVVVSPDCIVLTWDEVENASHYVIERADLTAGSPYESIDMSVYEYDVPFRDCYDIVPGHRYSYRISTSEPGFGEGDYASVSAAAPDVLPPTAVDASNGTSASKVTISWTGYDYADGYTVVLSRSADGPWDTVAADITDTTATDWSVVPGVVYYYAVATDLDHYVSPLGDSDDGYAGTLPTAAPGSPAKPEISETTLSWTVVAGATEYRVYRADTLGDAFEPVSSWQTGTDYQDTTMTEGILYRFAVTARNQYGESALSEAVYGYVGTMPSLGPPPTLSLVAVDSHHVSLSWTAVSFSICYTVEQGGKTSNGYSYWQHVEDSVEALACVDSLRVPPIDTLGYRVAAVHPLSGRGKWSDVLPVCLADADTSDTTGLGASDSLMVDTAFRFFTYATLVCTVNDTVYPDRYRPLMLSVTRSPDSTVVRKDWDYHPDETPPPRPYTLTDTLELIDHEDSTSSYRLTGILSRISSYEPQEPTQSRIVTDIVGTLSLTGGRFDEIRYDITETQTTFQPSGDWEIRYTGTVYYDDIPVAIDEYAPVSSNR